MVIGGGMKAISGYQQQQALADESEANARNLKRQSLLERDATSFERARELDNANRLQAKQVSSASASGFGVSGSTLDFIQSAAVEQDLDVQTIGYNGGVKADNLQLQSKQQKYNAKSQRRGAIAAGLAPIIETAAKLGGGFGQPGDQRVAFTADRLRSALIQQESAGVATAVSPKGALGLMQVMPGTAKEIAAELGDKDFPSRKADIAEYMKDPETNVRYGMHYLEKQLKTFDGDVEAALIAYNAGPGNARKWLKAGPSGITGIGVGANIIHADLGGRRSWGYGAGGSTSRKDVPDWAEATIKNHLAGSYEQGMLTASGVDPRLASLSYDTRQKLIGQASRAMTKKTGAAKQAELAAKADLKTLMQSDLESIEASGENAAGLEMEAISNLLGEAETQKHLKAQQHATDIYNATANIAISSDAEIDDILNQTEPRPASPNFANEQRVYEAAQDEAERVRELRQDKPGAGAQIAINTFGTIAKRSNPDDGSDLEAVQTEMQQAFDQTQAVVDEVIPATPDSATNGSADTYTAQSPATVVLTALESAGVDTSPILDAVNDASSQLVEIFGRPDVRIVAAPIVDTITAELKKVGIDAAPVIADIQRQLEALAITTETNTQQISELQADQALADAGHDIAQLSEEESAAVSPEALARAQFRERINQKATDVGRLRNATDSNQTGSDATPILEAVDGGPILYQDKPVTAGQRADVLPKMESELAEAEQQFTADQIPDEFVAKAKAAKTAKPVQENADVEASTSADVSGGANVSTQTPKRDRTGIAEQDTTVDESVGLRQIADNFKRLLDLTVRQGKLTLRGKKGTTVLALRDAIQLAMGEEPGSKGRTKFDQQRLDDFNAYLVARRAVQEYSRYNSGDLMRPPVSLNEGDVRQAIRDFEGKYGADFSDAAEMVYQYQQAMWRKDFEAGFIDLDTYKAGAQKVDYVPFMRDLSDKKGTLGDSGLTSGKASIVKRFRGSDRDIINPLESIMQRTFAQEQNIARNEIRRMLARLADRAGVGSAGVAERISANKIRAINIPAKAAIDKILGSEAIDPVDRVEMQSLLDAAFDDQANIQIFRSEVISENGERIVFFWENGKRQAIQLGDDQLAADLMEALAATGSETMPFLGDFVALSSNIFRATITSWPDFLMVNYIRDQMSAWVLTDVGYKPFVSGIKGMKEEVTSSDMARDYSAARGVMGGMTQANLHQARTNRDIKALETKGYAAEIWGDIKNPWNLSKLARGVSKFTELSETGTRIGIYGAAFNRAKSEAYELAANHDTFSGRQIVPDYVKSRPNELQFNAYTSEIAKQIGELTGLSPMMVDHVITGFGASAAKDIITVTNGMINPERTGTGFDEQPIFRRFYRDATRGSAAKSDFWKQASTFGGSMHQAGVGFKHYLDSGNLQEANRFLESLSDIDKPYAVLWGSFEAKHKRLHPFYHARKLNGVLTRARDEIRVGSKLEDSVTGETLQLTASDARQVDDLLSEWQRREVRNAMIVTGASGWSDKKMMPVEATEAILRELSPTIMDEVMRRMNKGKVYDRQHVYEVWPELRERLLDDQDQAFLEDLLP
eukprot:g14901.t1